MEGAPRPGPRRFRFGVSVGPTPSGAAWRSRAQRVEALGFDTLLLPDHLDDAFPPLAAAAEATRRLHVGTLVANNDLRHPVLLGREAATLGLLSDGRFELGAGAGYLRSESSRQASSSTRRLFGSRAWRSRSGSCGRCWPGNRSASMACITR
jgi:alkanesulfonate monooxygenase SsuD/methylene tetrahydromethanopterin reductase-like flavin-dependent oxidoreductase (luciferase family)